MFNLPFFMVLFAMQGDFEGVAELRPNIVWICAEDMSPWLSCYGDMTVPTPHIDKLARRGILYTNAYANAPVCAPARATLITGCYATSIGAMHMRTGNPSKAALERNPSAYDGIPSYEATPPPQVQCFPEILRSEGYYCTNNSKTDYQFNAPVTVWDHSGRGAHWRNRYNPSQPFFSVFNIGVTHESGTFPTTKRQPSVVNASEVTVPPYYPDTELVRNDIARTYDNIAALDIRVGKIISNLYQDGLLENTIIFFFSDHGVGLPRGKRSVYDSGTRVPFIVAIPFGQSFRDDRLVSFIDFAPTVLSLAGISPPDWMVGRPFLGKYKTNPARYVFFHADRMDARTDRTRAITDGKFKFIENHFLDRPRLYPVAYMNSIPMMKDIELLRESGKASSLQWQISSDFKPREEIYFLSSDPYEIDNRINDETFAEDVVRLRDALRKWQDESDDLGMFAEPEMVKSLLWPPSGTQPQTSAPSLVVSDNGFIVKSATRGASVAWRLQGSIAWSLGSAPFSLKSGQAYELLAHRIGYQPSKIVSGIVD